MIAPGEIPYVESLRELSEGGIMNVKAITLAAIAVAAFTASAFAHHSFTMFDETKTMTLSGVVKEFEWTNPHSWLRVMVTDEKTGKAGLWAVRAQLSCAVDHHGHVRQLRKTRRCGLGDVSPHEGRHARWTIPRATLANGKVISRADAGTKTKKR